LYKEDFTEFKENFKEMTEFIISEKGSEVISDRHQKNYSPKYKSNEANEETSEFSDVDFDEV
jgi:hypothetical protein